MARILILGVRVPFTRGGQEALVGSLTRELKARGHEVDLVEIPFRTLPKEDLLNQAAVWRTMDVEEAGGQKVDLVIATKFPSYFARHPRKSLWLVHQHRALYDLYGSRFSDISDDPRDEALREMLVTADTKVMGECAYRSGISANVVKRLQHFNGLDSEVLYPPLPLGNRYRTAPAEPFVLSVGRLCSIKRVDLMIKALTIVHSHVHLHVVGTEDEPGVMNYFLNEIGKHHLQARVKFLGRVSDDDLIDQYARAAVVYYAPHDEDYGYVTLEGMASSKPILTAHDSGGTLEFVRHEETGLVVEPTVDAVGHAVNRCIENPELSERLGRAGRVWIEGSGLLDAGWDRVVSRLLSPLERDVHSLEERSSTVAIDVPKAAMAH